MISTIITNQFSDRMSEGGPAMYIILIAFLLSLFFIVMAFVKRNKNNALAQKMIGLAVESSLIALVIGCLASVMGIIQLFDMVEALGDVSPSLFSGGLKVALLTITFGLFSFVVARTGILIYNWSLKSNEENLKNKSI
ncbi:MotA/TolQ/ExbB proton channel family protein [Winogradskyella sp.]|uniref:MotA/TolQ/ExbB proton channel family protein n=1 Tax=Winogradskyella sp. TaxID=1883156 RepID=UPI0035149BE1